METAEVRFKDSELEVPLASGPVEKAFGLRFARHEMMVFETGGTPVLDSLLVPGELHLYFIEGGEVVETGTLDSWSFYRPEEESEYLLESFQPLSLSVGNEVEMERR